MSEQILTFNNTHSAIAGERALLEAHIPVKVMPLPDAIAAGCGLCLRLSAEQLSHALHTLAASFVKKQAVYAMENGVFSLLAVEEEPVFSQALGLVDGDVVAIVGCGGKTALLNKLATENAAKKVLLSTTTHIGRPVGLNIQREVDLSGDWEGLPPQPGICLVHGGDMRPKLQGAVPEVLEEMAGDFDVTLLECDGSKQLPLKGWAEYEPVVPSFATLTVGVCTLWPVGQPLSEANTHRPEIFSSITGAEMGEEITLSHIAAMLSHPQGMMRRAVGRKILLINQVEDKQAKQAAGDLLRLLPIAFRQDITAVLSASVGEQYCQIMEEK